MTSKDHRLRTILFVLSMATIVFLGGLNDYRSCLRTTHVRGALRVFFVAQAIRAQERASVDHGLARDLDIRAAAAATKAARNVRPITCTSVPPPA